ncbi:MAG: (5-formylfuran-3-yl)methyl phosphate synthase [Rubrivivax sp.]
MVTRLLVSVRDAAEALLAAANGADFIDCKEPGQGALGGLPVATIAEIVSALRDTGRRLPVSATIGDWPMSERATILARVGAVAASGADIVKVGIEREPAARAVLDDLAASGIPLVPVFVADRGLDFALVEHALGLGFAGVMVDTADKRAGSLFDLLPADDVKRFVSSARSAGVMVGVAGALRRSQVPAVAALGPDFAGFRSAVCEGSRAGALSAALLRALAASMRDAAQAPIGRSSPSSSERARASSVR